MHGIQCHIVVIVTSHMGSRNKARVCSSYYHGFMPFVCDFTNGKKFIIASKEQGVLHANLEVLT